MKFHDFHDFCGIFEQGRPWPGVFGHPHPPLSSLTPICIIRVCARAQPGMLCSHQGEGGGEGVLRPALSQTLSKGEQHPNKLKFVGMLKKEAIQWVGCSTGLPTGRLTGRLTASLSLAKLM